MKHIQKGPEPPELADFKQEWAAEGRTPKWKDLTGPCAEAIRGALFAEQGHICCYCGRRLVPNDNHIEHLVPRDGKSGDPSLTFVWPNLLASCQANLLKGDPKHCGSKKENWYDRTLMVSPLDPSCEERFHFELDGRIRAAQPSDLGAEETIRRLDLDGARLRGLRKKAIEGLFVDLDEDLRPEEYDALAKAFRERDSQGRYEAFCFVLLAALGARHVGLTGAGRP
ncbi:retron system putative HNH endonuclease [Polyangium sp. 15x6]|uniref:retron system putative HNH endonuclease n=1 Tax=Polyangium sp. 15x6 TaxID=3042687 RepID=UPI00249C36F4|nr:retron system putative HNH endonuclease [Polyangium sp. 15x6]MDI3291781.1 TIGR02646 family protein [Polyangium sp. 15x6]